MVRERALPQWAVAAVVAAVGCSLRVSGSGPDRSEGRIVVVVVVVVGCIRWEEFVIGCIVLVAEAVFAAVAAAADSHRFADMIVVMLENIYCPVLVVALVLHGHLGSLRWDRLRSRLVLARRNSVQVMNMLHVAVV